MKPRTFELSEQDLSRFWKRVRGAPGDACWEWQGGRTSSGYGTFQWTTDQKHHIQGPHHISYRLHCGTIPDGLCVCHHCNNKICVNPEHLYLATIGENVQHAHAAGLFTSPNRQGECNPHSRLTREDVIALRVLDRNGIPRVEIAEWLNVSIAHVGRIVRYQSWAHVP